MTIIISNTSKTPVYLQIAQQMREALLRGELKEGELLPSVRMLSGDLGVSVITIKKAYDLLEEQGLVVTHPGKGSYVRGQNLEVIREFQLKEVQDILLQVVDMAKKNGFTKEEVLELLELLYEE